MYVMSTDREGRPADRSGPSISRLAEADFPVRILMTAFPGEKEDGTEYNTRQLGMG